MIDALLTRYRRSGADPPFGDPRHGHGSVLEGYFWRLTEPRSGTVVIVMASANRDRGGQVWGTAAVAASPSPLAVDVVADGASVAARGAAITVTSDGRTLLEGSERRLVVDLAQGARLDVSFDACSPWRRRALGALGPGHLVPGLSQYWHPYVLGGRVSGSATLAGRTLRLDGASVYAEKNWSPHGFPGLWWWGQAQAFPDPEVCVAFAGGRVGRGRVTVRASAVVARIGSLILSAADPLQPVRGRFGPDRWQLRALAGRHTITVEGEANGTAPHRLPVPIPAERAHLAGAAHQHLAGRLQLTVRRGRRLVYSDVSELAGLEYGAVG